MLQVATKDEYDKVIVETEAAYLKVRLLCTFKIRLALAAQPARLAPYACAVDASPAWLRLAPPCRSGRQGPRQATLQRVCCAIARRSQILESSQTLLTVLKRENIALHKKRQAAT